MRLSSDRLTSARQRYAIALYNQDYGGTTTPLCHFVKSTALRDMTRALIADDREGEIKAVYGGDDENGKQ